MRNQEVGDHARQLLAEAMPVLGVAVHQRLGLREVVRVAAFDRIRGQGERRAREPDQRNAPVELSLNLPDGVEHVAQRLSRLEDAQAIDVGRPLDGAFDLRTLALDEVEGQTHRGERQQQVREQNRGIDLEPPNRLQRDLGGQIGRAADLEQGILRAQGSVLLHVSPGLAHEPDRGGVNGFAAAGLQKAGGGHESVPNVPGRGAASVPDRRMEHVAGQRDQFVQPEWLEAHLGAERLDFARSATRRGSSPPSRW